MAAVLCWRASLHILLHHQFNPPKPGNLNLDIACIATFLRTVWFLCRTMYILEEQRHIHEDLERLEQGIADRVRDEPKHVCLLCCILHIAPCQLTNTRDL